MTEYYRTLEKREVGSVEMQALSQRMMPNGWYEPRPPTPAVRTRLNHRHLREQSTMA
jgi:hypothetical protein